MKTIIAGSREPGCNVHIALDAVHETFSMHITEVVSGTARGVDQLGETWAENLDIPVTRMPADWDGQGRSAGYVRNEQMAKYADACICIWDGQSRGTKHMIDLAKKYQLALVVYRSDTAEMCGYFEGENK